MDCLKRESRAVFPCRLWFAHQGSISTSGFLSSCLSLEQIEINQYTHWGGGGGGGGDVVGGFSTDCLLVKCSGSLRVANISPLPGI